MGANSGFIESVGHVAALYQNELYDRATSRAGIHRIVCIRCVCAFRSRD